MAAMDSSEHPQSPSERIWLTRDRVLTIALGIATLLAVYLCCLLVKPFVPAITMAVAVAVATKGWHNWLRRKVRSRSLAAGLGVVLVACLIVVPLTILIIYLVRQVSAEVQQFLAAGNPSDWRTVLHLPPVFVRALDWVEANFDVPRHLTRLGQSVMERAGEFLAGSLNLFTQLVIMLFVLFFFYRDREEALKAIRSVVPLSIEEAQRMFTRVEETIRATVNGSLTVAFLQALLAGLMYAMLNVPAPVCGLQSHS